jgi:hypothetical protein
MLQKLGEHIAACRARAEKCESIAANTTDVEVKVQFRALAEQWRHVAQSYENVESLERFLLDAHKQMLADIKPPTESTED